MSAKAPIEDVDSDDEDNQKEIVTEPVVEIDSSLNNCDVITKYQEATKIAQAVLVEVANLVGLYYYFNNFRVAKLENTPFYDLVRCWCQDRGHLQVWR